MPGFMHGAAESCKDRATCNSEKVSYIITKPALAGSISQLQPNEHRHYQHTEEKYKSLWVLFECLHKYNLLTNSMEQSPSREAKMS
jgi:hypothetical protein